MLIRIFGVCKGADTKSQPSEAVVILRGGAMEWVSVRLKADARLTQSATTRFSLLFFLWVTVSLEYAKETVTTPAPWRRGNPAHIVGEKCIALSNEICCLSGDKKSP